jgi:hypothetical protein
MTIIVYPPECEDAPNPGVREATHALRQQAKAIREAFQHAELEERRQRSAKSRVVTFRIPAEMLDRFDLITQDAATNRGHMLRQIVAEYICYVDECAVRYGGSLLTAHMSKRTR